MPLKVVLAAVLAVFIATSVARGDNSESEAKSPEGLDWRCHVIVDFAPYCDAIRAAVEGREPQDPAPATAESHEAGTRITLDFRRSAVSGPEMSALLLAADSLLPDHIGAIELRNLILQGTLQLNRTNFQRALTLDEVQFVDDEGTCLDPSGVSIDGSHFDKQLRLSRVRGCASLQVISSRLAGGLVLDNEESFRSALRGRIVVNQSRIDRQLFILGWQVSDVRVALSRFDSVTLRDVKVNNSLQFRDSKLFSLSAYAITFPSLASLRGNHIDDSVNLSELSISDVSSGGSRQWSLLERAFHFADNEVNGRLLIGIKNYREPAIVPNILLGDKPVILRVHHNRIAGSADFFIEEGLPAEIDLRGSKFANELLLTRACIARAKEKVGFGSCRQRCGLPSGEESFCAVDPNHRISRQDSSPFEIRLAAVEVDSLVWNLRGSGVRWSGPGLRYTYWDSEPRRGQRPYEIRGGGQIPLERPSPMQAWLHDQLEKTADAVDPLTFGAVYLKEHGRVAEAAGARLSALRSNLWNKVKTESAEALPPGFAFLGSVIFYAALAPVGWGARPEWALLGMTIMVLAFWWLYLWHSRRSRKRNWPDENLHSWDVQISRLELRDAVTEVVAAIANGRSEDEKAQVALARCHKRVPPSTSVRSGADPNQVLQACVGIAQRDPPAFSLVPGFNQYNNTFPPRRFSLFLFSLDAMLPVISLHHFDRYYPTNIDANFEQTPYQWVRWASIAQHGIGWWLSTVFVASLFV